MGLVNGGALRIRKLKFYYNRTRRKMLWLCYVHVQHCWQLWTVDQREYQYAQASAYE
jgi:hypothetical protein